MVYCVASMSFKKQICLTLVVYLNQAWFVPSVLGLTRSSALVLPYAIAFYLNCQYLRAIAYIQTHTQYRVLTKLKQ